MSGRACPICSWPTRLVLTEAGQRLYVDPVPDELGTIVRVEYADHRIRARVLSGKDMPWLGDVNQDVGPFVAHLRTCGRQGRPRKTPCCDACGTELHPIITARSGRRHWLCGAAPKPHHLFQPSAPEAPAAVQTELLPGKTGMYRHEMGTPAEHRELAEALTAAAAAVVVSGYAHPLYDDHLYAGWHRAEIAAGTGQATHKGYQERTEVLWSNRPLADAGLLSLLDDELALTDAAPAAPARMEAS